MEAIFAAVKVAAGLTESSDSLSQGLCLTD